MATEVETVLCGTNIAGLSSNLEKGYPADMLLAGM